MRTAVAALLVAVATCALWGCAPAAEDAAPSRPGLELLIAGSAFHGVHGLTVTADGRLLAGSVVGQAIYQVDPDSGLVSEWIGPPEGMADDLEEGPGGRLVWTGYLTGDVYARTGDGPIERIASGLPSVNSLAFSPDGRLFVSQVFGADALWELDPAGQAPPRKVAEDLGGLNGFDFGPDGMIYGPVWFRGAVARVNPESGTVQTVADGLGTPAAANFDPQGRLFVLDTASGEVLRVDTQTGDKTVVATLPPGLDNLAFAADGRMFVSNTVHAAVYQVNPDDGSSRALTQGALATPAGLAAWEDDGKVTLYVADTFAYRTVDVASRAVTDQSTAFAESDQEITYPVWASVDDDHVVLASFSTGTVQILDRRSGKGLRIVHGFAAPEAALELPDDRLLVADVATDAVLRSGPAGENPEKLLEGIGGPVGMIRGAAGKVLLTSSAGALLELDPESGAHRELATGLALPEGLALLPDGRIAVAEVGLRRLVAIDPDDGALEVLLEDLPVGLPAPVGLPPAFVPTGVAADSQGNIYLTSDLQNAIYRLRTVS